MSDQVIRSVTATAPAKVNLFLGIGRTRDDGFHELDTVFQAIDLADTVTFRVVEGEGPVQLTCEPSCDIPPEQNLVMRAVTSFTSRLQVTVEDLVGSGNHLAIQVEKNIPQQAGLAGGSTDAAAALVCCRHLLEDGSAFPDGDACGARADGSSPDSACVDAARSLGSDVPFFLYGGCARMTGRGDVFESALPPLLAPLVIVDARAGERGVSTAAAYRAFDASPVPAGDVCTMCDALLLPSGRGVGEEARARDLAVAHALSNNLEPAARAVSPSIARHLDWLGSREGVLGSLMSGSGSAAFAICGSDADARRIVDEALEQGFWARAVHAQAEGAHIIGPCR